MRATADNTSRHSAIEERELLGAVRLVVGRIQIDGDTPRPPVQATPMPLDDARCCRSRESAEF